MTINRVYLGPVEQVGEDEIAGICVSSGLKRDNAEWVPSGIDLTAFRQNPVILRDHDSSKVVGTATQIGLVPGGNAIAIRIQFAPLGISPDADVARGLAKSGALRALSAGIDPIDVEPIRGSGGGVRVLSAELLEVSLVAVPADADALVTARSYRAGPRMGAVLRALPRLSASAIRRALDQVRSSPETDRPVGLMSDFERAAFYREGHARRTLAVSAVRFARDVERRERSGYEARQEDLARLSTKH
jgi:HK97 family phage prohead protease